MYNCTHLRLDENKNMIILRGRVGEGAGKEGTWVWGLMEEEKLEGERGSRTNYNEER